MKYLFGIIIIFYSCNKRLVVIKSPTVCNELKKDIAEHWRLSSDSSFYETNFKFLNRVDSIYKSCLLNERNVISLLGKPNKRGNSYHRLELIYHIDKPCTTEHNYSCSDFVVYFDIGDTVRGTVIISTDIPSIQHIK